MTADVTVVCSNCDFTQQRVLSLPEWLEDDIGYIVLEQCKLCTEQA